MRWKINFRCVRLVCLEKTCPIPKRARWGLRVGEWYGRRRFPPEKIITKLREVKVVAACRQIGIAEQTLYRWRKEYRGLKVDQARRMKDLSGRIRA